MEVSMAGQYFYCAWVMSILRWIFLSFSHLQRTAAGLLEPEEWKV